MKAVVVENKAPKLKDVAIPKPKAGEILVKVKAAAQNPTDWKHVANFSSDGIIVGCDFAGIVEEHGEGVTSPPKGTRVAGFVQGSTWPELGSYAEYVRAYADLVWEVPAATSFEDAAAIGGIAMETAYQALNLKLGLATPFSPTKTPETVLIWAGSTSVGQYAIQLASQAGYKVVTTASPKNFDFLKSLGASAVYDYRDDQTPRQIKQADPEIKYGLDCVSEGNSVKQASASLSSGGKLITLLPPPKDLDSSNGVKVEMTLVYLTRGYAFKYFNRIDFPAHPEDKKQTAQWLKEFPKLLEDGKFVANKVKVLGGLDKVDEGFEYMKSGKLSAEKIVYTV